MAEITKTTMDHKSGIKRIINIEYKRATQEFVLSYDTLISLFSVVLDPSKIKQGANRKYEKE